MKSTSEGIGRFLGKDRGVTMAAFASVAASISLVAGAACAAGDATGVSQQQNSPAAAALETGFGMTTRRAAIDVFTATAPAAENALLATSASLNHGSICQAKRLVVMNGEMRLSCGDSTQAGNTQRELTALRELRRPAVAD